MRSQLLLADSYWFLYQLRFDEGGGGGGFVLGDLLGRALGHDLAEAELSYSPQEGSAKDPVNQLALAAVNNLDGLHPLAHRSDITADAYLLDVREEAEVQRAPYAHAVNIPLSQLRDRLSELPQARELLVFCQSGVRGHSATALLNDRGFRARHLSGGYISLTRPE